MFNRRKKNPGSEDVVTVDFSEISRLPYTSFTVKEYSIIQKLLDFDKFLDTHLEKLLPDCADAGNGNVADNLLEAVYAEAVHDLAVQHADHQRDLTRLATRDAEDSRLICQKIQNTENEISKIDAELERLGKEGAL